MLRLHIGDILQIAYIREYYLKHPDNTCRCYKNLAKISFWQDVVLPQCYVIIIALIILIELVRLTL